MRDKLRESLAFLPRRSEPWIWITKPSKSRIKKFIGRRGVATGALSVEGPAKDELRGAIVFSSHPSEPMVYQRRFSDPGPGNDGNDIYTLVSPCCIQESNIFLSTKQIAPCNGQPGYGNLFRSKSCPRLARSETRNGRGRLLQAVTTDSTPRVDGASYRRYRIQKIGRVLEAPPGIFLKVFLKENYDRLWDIFELFER